MAHNISHKELFDLCFTVINGKLVFRLDIMELNCFIQQRKHVRYIGSNVLILSQLLNTKLLIVRCVSHSYLDIQKGVQTFRRYLQTYFDCFFGCSKTVYKLQVKQKLTTTF